MADPLRTRRSAKRDLQLRLFVLNLPNGLDRAGRKALRGWCYAQDISVDYAKAIVKKPAPWLKPRLSLACEAKTLGVFLSEVWGV